MGGGESTMVTQGIDARGDDELGMGQSLGTLAHGENACILFVHIGAQGLPYMAVRAAHVDVSPPDPLGLPRRTELQKRRRLGIMDDDDVGVLERPPQFGEVLCFDVEIGIPVFLRQGDALSLQPVVNRLGHGKKSRRAADHLPFRIETQIAHQWCHPGQDFCHAFSLRRGVDVDDLESPEFFRQLMQLPDDGGTLSV